jgi:hypothetical protein
MKLSASVVDEQEDEARMFSRESLKELFRLNENTQSDTHDVYKSVILLSICTLFLTIMDNWMFFFAVADANGVEMANRSSRPRQCCMETNPRQYSHSFLHSIHHLMDQCNLIFDCGFWSNCNRWNHYTNPHMVDLHDDLLRSEVGLNEVTACFQYISTWSKSILSYPILSFPVRPPSDCVYVCIASHQNRPFKSTFVPKIFIHLLLTPRIINTDTWELHSRRGFPLFVLPLRRHVHVYHLYLYPLYTYLRPFVFIFVTVHTGLDSYICLM